MALGLGSDFSCVTDLDANLSLVSGRRALAESIARRLGTPKLHLFYDPEYGEDLSQLVGASVKTNRIQVKAETESLQDDRVQDVRVTVDLKEPGLPGVGQDQVGDMTIDVEITDENGPFDLTLDVSVGEVSLNLLAEGL